MPVSEDAEYGYPDENRIKEIRSIREQYSESGLYRNDGSTTPLWNIQYFSRPQRGDVYIAPDGEHLIFGADGFFAGWFFAHGRRLAGYTVDDLVSHKLVKSMMSFRVPTCLWDHFDADSMTYTVHTNQGEEFTFDATTGGLIGAKSPWPAYFAAICAGLIAVLGVTVLVRRHRARQNQ